MRDAFGPKSRVPVPADQVLGPILAYPSQRSWRHRSQLRCFHAHADLFSEFEFWDSAAQEFPAAKPSILLNLQLTSSYFHNDVTRFLYGENEFYFSCPDSLEHFLLCLQGGPFNVNPVRHLGAVILDLRRRTSFPWQGHAWPIIPSDASHRNCTTTDWDERLGQLPKSTSTWLLWCP